MVFCAESKRRFEYGDCFCMGMRDCDNTTKLSNNLCFDRVPCQFEKKGEYMNFWVCVFIIFWPVVVMADIASIEYTDNGLAFKADDSAVVHKTGTETIEGVKTFSDTITSTKSGYILSGSNIGIRNNANPLVGLIANGTGGYLAYLQATGSTVDDAILYLGPTSTKAMAFKVSDGAISMPNSLTVANSITVQSDVATASDSNQVATTKWTNDKIDTIRGRIPVGGVDSSDMAQIWVE